MSAKQGFAIVQGYFDREAKRYKAREQFAYDGVLGLLPQWSSYTEHDRGEFVRLRNKVLDHFWPASDDMREIDPKHIDRNIAEVVKEWISSYQSVRTSPWPPDEWEEVVARLAIYWGVYKMGKKAGREFYIGKNKGNVAAGKAKRGKLGVVTRLVKALKVKTLDELLEHLERDIKDEDNDGDIAALRASRSSPIDFRTLEVVRPKGRVDYITAGKEKKVGFDHLKNLLRK